MGLCGSAKVPSSSGHSVVSGKHHQKNIKWINLPFWSYLLGNPSEVICLGPREQNPRHMIGSFWTPQGRGGGCDLKVTKEELPWKYGHMGINSLAIFSSYLSRSAWHELTKTRKVHWSQTRDTHTIQSGLSGHSSTRECWSMFLHWGSVLCWLLAVAWTAAAELFCTTEQTRFLYL